MPTLPSRCVLLCFDGVVHASDLPVQAFARHLTEQLAADQTRPIIAGMRGFLEGRTELIPPGIDLSDAEDGYQAVEILARTAGLDSAAIRAAQQESRRDLAASAWAVDQGDGLDALLAEVAGRAAVLLLTEPGDPAVRPVLESIGLHVGEILATPITLAIKGVLHRTGAAPDRVLVIGTRWAEQLQPAREQGCTTALVDRFGDGLGVPAFRSPDLAGLRESVRGWVRTGSQ